MQSKSAWPGLQQLEERPLVMMMILMMVMMMMMMQKSNVIIPTCTEPEKVVTLLGKNLHHLHHDQRLGFVLPHYYYYYLPCWACASRQHLGRVVTQRPIVDYQIRQPTSTSSRWASLVGVSAPSWTLARRLSCSHATPQHSRRRVRIIP